MLTFGGRGTSTQVLLSMRALYSSHKACFQLRSRRAWKGDLGIGEEVVGGGGGGVVGGVGVVCGDGVDRGVGGVDCEVKAPISAMIVRVPTKDRWCVLVEQYVDEQYSVNSKNFTPENSNSFGGAINGNIGDPMMKMSKKINHNASKIDRRKRVNDLYANLCSLLPILADQKKSELSRFRRSDCGGVLDGLGPSLEVDTLIRRKQKLSSYSTLSTSTRQKNIGIKRQSSKDTTSNSNSLVVASVSILGEKGVVIQLIFSMDHMNKNTEIGSMSRVLTYLESEENGFVLLNSTTFKCSGDHMLLNTLHLQVQGDKKADVEMLKEKLCHFSQ
nr:transcription factor ORG2-like [Tanacetum cinerariifolium]